MGIIRPKSVAEILLQEDAKRDSQEGFYDAKSFDGFDPGGCGGAGFLARFIRSEWSAVGCDSDQDQAPGEIGTDYPPQ